jgi:hypothetical protein
MNLPVQLCEKDKAKQQKLVSSIIRDTSFEEQVILKDWCQNLISLRNSNDSRVQKLKKTFLINQNVKVILPILKLISKKIKKYAWDKRDPKSRLGLMGLGVGATMFAGQSAGIAAMGSAIGVPLWIVFGAGGTFAGFIIEEIQRHHANQTDIIDAEFVEVETKEAS